MPRAAEGLRSISSSPSMITHPCSTELRAAPHSLPGGIPTGDYFHNPQHHRDKNSLMRCKCWNLSTKNKRVEWWKRHLSVNMGTDRVTANCWGVHKVREASWMPASLMSSLKYKDGSYIFISWTIKGCPRQYPVLLNAKLDFSPLTLGLICFFIDVGLYIFTFGQSSLAFFQTTTYPILIHVMFTVTKWAEKCDAKEGWLLVCAAGR